MSDERLLNTKEAAQFLGITERQLKDLVKSGKLVAYQIGGMYLRFQLKQLKDFKNSNQPIQRSRLSPLDDVRDFLYFNDFYILATLIIIVLLAIILKNIS